MTLRGPPIRFSFVWALAVRFASRAWTRNRLYVNRVRIEAVGVQIDRMKFEVRFYFDTDERLKEVGLSPEGGETKIAGITIFYLFCLSCRARSVGPKQLLTTRQFEMFATENLLPARSTSAGTRADMAAVLTPYRGIPEVHRPPGILLS